ncbi:halocyanin domain-containing protein [Halovenus rubra]|uniref:Halocyanin domain-containing protein n=2 Tax=Halovenus rubra TaxID=869890 RepID=A0ACC7DYQ6_9EURY|nr:halocyanin domain-containing protein [Halovenus rubra]
MTEDTNTTRRRYLQAVGGVSIGAALLSTASQPVSAQETSDEEWRQFGHDLANTRYAPENTGPTSDVKKQWAFETGNFGWSSPAVVDGTVYVGSHDNNVYALDAEDGSEQWTFETGDGVSSSPAVVDGTVYVGSGDHNVYALDAEDGSEQWAFETGDYVTRSSPAVVNGTVYVGSNDNNVYAIGGGDSSGTDDSTDGSDSDGSTGGSNPDGGSDVKTQVDDYLAEANGYDGSIADRTGKDAISIKNGVNHPHYAFGHAAVRIDVGTEVTWEWVSNGHSVTANEGAYFDSGIESEGFTWSQTFDEPGVILYECGTHAALGQLGAIIVEGESGSADGGSDSDSGGDDANTDGADGDSAGSTDGSDSNDSTGGSDSGVDGGDDSTDGADANEESVDRQEGENEQFESQSNSEDGESGIPVLKQFTDSGESASLGVGLAGLLGGGGYLAYRRQNNDEAGQNEGE